MTDKKPDYPPLIERLVTHALIKQVKRVDRPPTQIASSRRNHKDGLFTLNYTAKRSVVGQVLNI